MATALGARAPLHPSWLINSLTKLKLMHHLDKATLWQRYHNCSLEDLNHSTRGNDRHRDLATFLKLDQFDAEELKDAITTLHFRNLATSGSCSADKIKKELVDLSGETDHCVPPATLPDADPPKEPPTPQKDQDDVSLAAVCTTEAATEAPTVKVELGSERLPDKPQPRSPSRKRIKVALNSTNSAGPPARSHFCSTHSKTRASHNLRLEKGAWVCKSSSICVLGKAELALKKNKEETRDKADHDQTKSDLSNEEICRHISREARKGRYTNVGQGFFALSDVMPWASSHGLTRKNILSAIKDMLFQHLSDSRGSTLRYNLEQDDARKEVFIRVAPACSSKEF
jgi:hypothetical protein